jgi:hypothetical protein
LEKSDEARLSAEEIYSNSAEANEASPSSKHSEGIGQKLILFFYPTVSLSIIQDHAVIIALRKQSVDTFEEQIGGV